MIIRYNSGHSGIKEYLESGMKQERYYSRDQLDERVILSGDLSSTQETINTISEDKSSRYFHITLAFKEDHLEQEVLENITSDFKAFFLVAYNEAEIDFYAEAHLPKIKTYRDKDNNLVERKPHIHIVIPKVDLLTGTSFDPRIEFIEKYLNSFQEHTNAKYGLESPKDNLRVTFNDSSEMISRYKQDVFNASGREQKSDVLNLVVKHNPTSMVELQKLLISNGYQVRIRNQSKPDQAYLNIKQSGDEKGINLKDSVFRNGFLGMSREKKLSALTTEVSSKYIEATEAKPTVLEHKKNLTEWYNHKAYEVKYYRLMSSNQREKYYKLLVEDKVKFMQSQHEKFKDKHQLYIKDNNDGTDPLRPLTRDEHSAIDRKVGRDLGQFEVDLARLGNIDDSTRRRLREKLIRAGEERYRTNTLIGNADSRQTPKRSGIEQTAEDMRRDGVRNNFKNHIQELNSTIRADVLLELVEKTHGVNPELYFISKDNFGVDRIKCGNRNLTAVDFCTKELNLTFRESITLLDNTLNMQQDIDRAVGWSIHQDRYLRDQYQQWIKNYKEERNATVKSSAEEYKDARQNIISKYNANLTTIRTNEKLPYHRKQQELALNKSQKVFDLDALQRARDKEMLGIRENYNTEMQSAYRKFLAGQAMDGDEIALEELRRLRIQYEPGLNNQNSIRYVERFDEFRLNITHEIDEHGVINYIIDNKVIIKDSGKRIEVLDDSVDNIKLSLDLAIQKFGSKINLNGSEEFRREIVDTAIKNNYKLEFLDEFSKAYYQSRLAQIQQASEQVKTNNQSFVQDLPERCVILGASQQHTFNDSGS